jgi:thiamine pyrophosphate-dependent acetolactate synthase large subunit-like protein
MARSVADGLWEMLAAAGVRRCYGIVGDALLRSAMTAAGCGPATGRA